jgi:hypothetical protein
VGASLLWPADCASILGNGEGVKQIAWAHATMKASILT